jgi:hypothetical protein
MNRPQHKLTWTQTHNVIVPWMLAGWPDWADFRQLDDCFLWAVCEKVQKKPKYFICLFPWKKLCIKFDKKGLGYILGNIFKTSSGHPECLLDSRNNYCLTFLYRPTSFAFTEIHASCMQRCLSKVHTTYSKQNFLIKVWPFWANFRFENYRSISNFLAAFLPRCQLPIF